MPGTARISRCGWSSSTQEPGWLAFELHRSARGGKRKRKKTEQPSCTPSRRSIVPCRHAWWLWARRRRALRAKRATATRGQTPSHARPGLERMPLVPPLACCCVALRLPHAARDAGPTAARSATVAAGSPAHDVRRSPRPRTTAQERWPHEVKLVGECGQSKLTYLSMAETLQRATSNVPQRGIPFSRPSLARARETPPHRQRHA